MSRPLADLYLDPGSHPDPRLTLDPDEFILDRELRLTTGLRRSALAYARHNGRLQWARQREGVYYLGTWIIRWLEREEELVEQARLAAIGEPIVPGWRRSQETLDPEPVALAGPLEVLMGRIVERFEARRLDAVDADECPDGQRDKRTSGKLPEIPTSLQLRACEGRIKAKAVEPGGTGPTALFGEPTPFSGD